MKKITRSVIKLSEIPEYLQKNKIFNSHKIHTYAIFHIDDSEKDELSLWLIEKYHTIKRKISFLIHIDIEIYKEIEKEQLYTVWKAAEQNMRSQFSSSNYKNLTFDEYYETKT